MDIQTVAAEIREKIDRLRDGRKDLARRADNKANAIGEYEKHLAIVLIGLRNGKEYVLDGVAIKDPPVTIAERIARGICYQEKINAEKAEAEYRNAIAGMSALEAELNGLQSINRYLAE